MTREEKILQERQEIEGVLMFFAENKLDDRSSGIYKELEECIEHIFKLEIEEMGYELDKTNTNSKNGFLLNIKYDNKDTKGGSCSPTRRIVDGKLEISKPSIMYNLHSMCIGLDSDDKETRLTAVKDMFKTVFHELQHHRQEKMASLDVSSKNAITFARDFALHRYLARDFYTRDGKTGNYHKLLTENNANEVGYEQYLETIGKGDRRISDLRDIERGKSNTNRYNINVDSIDKATHYKTNGLEERADAAIPIMDDLITNRGFVEILKLYPILQKEYNGDGSKKSTIELIRNMQSEKNEIISNSSLTDEEKQLLIKDSQEMYYELIYRTLEKISPSQLNDLRLQIGNETLKQLSEEMNHYFQMEMENRIGKSASMALAQSNNGKNVFVAPSNDGTIRMTINGQQKNLTVDEFIQTLNPDLMEKQFNTPKGNFNAADFIKRFCFGYLSQDGIMTLKNGQQMSAKEFVEQYMLQKMQISKEYSPKRYIEDTVKSVDPWSIHQETKERLVHYYEGKKDVVKQSLGLEIEEHKEEKKQSIKLTPEQQEKKMTWVKEFISNYDCIENDLQYSQRVEDENFNMKLVVEGINNGVFVGEGLSEIDLNYYPQNKENSIERSLAKLARLLKAADNLTIDGGRNYLEEFSNIPNINAILLEVKKSESIKQMYDKAKSNKQNGLVPKRKNTQAETDKKLAQDYLKSDNKSKETVEEEIAYRKDVLRGADEVIVDFEAKTIQEIPILNSQKAALTRVLARQEGKVPSEVIFENGRCTFIIDTQKTQTQSRNQTTPNVSEASFDDEWGEYGEFDDTQNNQERISLNSLKKDLFRAQIDKSETQKQMSNMSKINEIKRLQKMQKMGYTLTEEQKILIEQHIRQTTQAQIDFQNIQNNKKSHGLEM